MKRKEREFCDNLCELRHCDNSCQLPAFVEWLTAHHPFTVLSIEAERKARRKLGIEPEEDYDADRGAKKRPYGAKKKAKAYTPASHRAKRCNVYVECHYGGQSVVRYDAEQIVLHGGDTLHLELDAHRGIRRPGHDEPQPDRYHARPVRRQHNVEFNPRPGAVFADEPQPVGEAELAPGVPAVPEEHVGILERAIDGVFDPPDADEAIDEVRHHGPDGDANELQPAMPLEPPDAPEDPDW